MQAIANVDLSVVDLNIIRRALIRAEFPNAEDQRKSDEAFAKIVAAIAGLSRAIADEIVAASADTK